MSSDASPVLWPHAPPHYLGAAGVYMVTAGTYGKEHFFRNRNRLQHLTNNLIALAKQHQWQMQAWAVFSNHYHFIASSPEDGAQNLGRWLGALHRRSATMVNKLDETPGRKVWHNYWESHITFEKSYYARLHYVHENPVKYGLVTHAEAYDWCSAAWFAEHAAPAFRKTVESFKIDRVNVRDDF
ncbi:MAG: transposase [Akkermansiaceae bacterium]|nr:transposase [Akkermansiaceae bacterium]